MQRLLSRRLALLAGLALLVAALPAAARAMMIAPAAIPQRVAQADVVVVGKVTSIEGKTVSAPQFPGAKDKVEYTIAVVKIADHLLGAKGETHVKVGFIVPKEVAPPKPGGPIAIGPRRYPQVKLTVDQEACLFLKKHHDGNFYVAQAYYDVIDKKAPTFEKDVAQAKKFAKLLADPKAGLASKDAGERAETAALLVTHYRVRPLGVATPKEEAIDADQSKQIMKALAEGDWTKGYSPTEITAQMAFNALGVTAKDGFKPPMFVPNEPPPPPTAYTDAAKAWVKKHADSYRIKKFVTDKKDEKKDEKKDK